MTPAEKLGRAVIGTIKVRDIEIKGQTLTENTKKRKGRTFEVIEITTVGETLVYITNRWYKEHENKPLQVPEQFVESYTPAYTAPAKEKP